MKIGLRGTRRLVLLAMLAPSACGGSASVDVSVHASASTESSSSSSSSTPPRTSGGEPATGSTTTSASTVTPPPREAPVTPPPQPAVVEPAADARVYIRLETPSTLDQELERDLLRVAEERIRMRVRAMPGVALAPAGEPVEAGMALMARRNLHGATLQCSVRRVGAGPQGTRATVAFLVTRFSSTDLLGAFDGGALVPGEPAADTPRLAVQGAVDSALRGLPQVLERAPSTR